MRLRPSHRPKRAASLWWFSKRPLLHRMVVGRKGDQLFCSDPRVGHIMDVISPFISVLWYFDWLFHRDSCPRIDVVHPELAWTSSPACTWHCSLHYLFSRQLIVSSWCDHSTLASLFSQCLAVPSLYPSFVKNPLICFLCCPRNPQYLSQPFHIKGAKAYFFILSECPAFTAVRCYRPH